MSHADTFWALADPYVAEPDGEKGTMMGFPCLRRGGEFVACTHRKSGALIVKLSAEMVQAHISAGRGESFAPAKRTFKEWLSVPPVLSESWGERLAEAWAFAGDGA